MSIINGCVIGDEGYASKTALNALDAKVTKFLSWAKRNNLNTGNYLNFPGNVIGSPSTGYCLDADYTVKALSWSFGEFSKSGRFTIANTTSGSILGTIEIGPLGSTPLQNSVSVEDGDFTEFTLPANQKIGLYWEALEGGNSPRNTNIILVIKEV